MKAICPNNKKHNKFGTCATVLQDWEVDSNGNFLNVIEDCLEVVHDPNPDNTWTCMICGANAIIEK